MFLQKAMRYYRFWIYSCNIILFLSTVMFIIAFVCIFSDARMSLFPNIRLYHPSLLYSYLALLIQGGVIQTIGFLGAVKMNEKLLNTYWCIIIALLFGDGVMGIIWMLRYNSVAANLRGDLQTQLNEEYSTVKEFQVLWDRIQSESHCCGIDGPFDYNMTKWMMLQSETKPIRRHELVPFSCCRSDPILPNDHSPIKSLCIQSYDPELIYVHGCYDSVLMWLQNSANILSVFGFCVISFVKFCFVCILKYEIKEMIQKIKVLKGMDECPVVPINNLEAYLPRPSVQQEAMLLTNQTPQSNYKSACATEKLHTMHHHHCGHNPAVRCSITPNGNELNTSLSKKQSIV